MWCDTARTPKVGPVDARVTVFMLIWLMHMTFTTLEIAIAAMAFFSVLAWFNVSIGSAFGWLKQIISGGGLIYRRSKRRALRRARL